MALGEILQTASVVIAASSAAIGFDSWRRSLVGQRRIQLAEDTLVLFLEARDAVSHIRSSFAFAGEGETRTAEANETPRQKEIRDSAYITIERYNRYGELFAKIRAVRYRFQAYFGEESAKPFAEMDGIIHNIIVSARMLARHRERELRGFRTEADQEKFYKRVEDAEGVIWEGLDNEDAIKTRMDSVIHQIESTCRHIIDPPSKTGLIRRKIREWFRSSELSQLR